MGWKYYVFSADVGMFVMEDICVISFDIVIMQLDEIFLENKIGVGFCSTKKVHEIRFNLLFRN